MSLLSSIAERSGAVGMARGWWVELRSNRRAMAGFLVILMLVVGEGFVLMRNATQQSRAAYDREMARLQRVTTIAQERAWPERAAASAAALAALEGRLWMAESDGVARADLQDWVTGMARDVGLSTLDVRIELATPKSLPADMRQISATITAQPSEAALIALLERVERAPHLLVVDRLNVRQQPAPFLEMVLICYARIGSKPGQPAALSPASRNGSGTGGDAGRAAQITGDKPH